MFKRLAKSGLVKFWPVRPRRIAASLREVRLSNPTYCNDNLPGFRRAAAAGKRRSPAPALACHWFDRDGRLECRWQAEPSDGGDFDEHGAMGGPAAPRRGLLHACHRTMPTNGNFCLSVAIANY